MKKKKLGKPKSTKLARFESRINTQVGFSTLSCKRTWPPRTHSAHTQVTCLSQTPKSAQRPAQGDSLSHPFPQGAQTYGSSASRTLPSTGSPEPGPTPLPTPAPPKPATAPRVLPARRLGARSLPADLFGTARASPPAGGVPGTATFAASARKPPRRPGPPTRGGVRAQPAPHTARAGTPRPRPAPGSGAPSQLQAEARRGLGRPSLLPPRLVTLGGVGDGTAGGGRGASPAAAAGAAAAGSPVRGDEKVRPGRGKRLHRRPGGRGEAPGSGRRERQGERGLARRADSREVAPESHDSRRL